MRQSHTHIHTHLLQSLTLSFSFCQISMIDGSSREKTRKRLITTHRIFSHSYTGPFAIAIYTWTSVVSLYMNETVAPLITWIRIMMPRSARSRVLYIGLRAIPFFRELIRTYCVAVRLIGWRLERSNATIAIGRVNSSSCWANLS